MNVIKFYDAACDTCGNWYGSIHVPPRVSNRKLAQIEMQSNGWGERGVLTLCKSCIEKQNRNEVTP